MRLVLVLVFAFLLGLASALVQAQRLVEPKTSAEFKTAITTGAQDGDTISCTKAPGWPLTIFDLGTTMTNLSVSGTAAKGITVQDCRWKGGIDTKNKPYWHFLRIESSMEGRGGYQSGKENLRMSGKGCTLKYSTVFNNTSSTSPTTWGGVLAIQGDTAVRDGVVVNGNAIGNGHYPAYLQHRRADGPLMVTSNVFFDGRPRADNTSGYLYHLYGQGAEVDNIKTQDNVFDKSWITIGRNGGEGSIGNTFERNIVNYSSVALNYGSFYANDVTAVDNVFYEARLTFNTWVGQGRILVTGNQFYSKQPKPNFFIRTWDKTTNQLTCFAPTDRVQGNTFLLRGGSFPDSINSNWAFKTCPAGVVKSRDIDNGTITNFTQHLTESGCTGCTNNVAVADRPVKRVTVKSSGEGFGYIVCTHNVDLTPWQATVDLSPIVAAGASYKITKSRDGYYGTPIASGTYNGPITLTVPDDFEPYLVSPGGSAPPPPITPTITPTITPAITLTRTLTRTATATATRTATATPTATRTPTRTPTLTPTMTDLEQQERIIALEKAVYTPTP